MDPAPRVVVDPELGVLAAGRRVADAVIADDVYEHTTWVIERAVALGGYASVTEPDVFDVEYWELEQAKLARQPAPAAAHRPGGGRHRRRLGDRPGLRPGAARRGRRRGRGRPWPTGSTRWTAAPPTRASGRRHRRRGPRRPPSTRRSGPTAGVDILVLNAGSSRPPCRSPRSTPALWRAAMDVNAGAAALALAAAHPFLCRAPGGGRVVVVGSKNVPAPGAGGGAYSASKAALTQLARVAALEWAGDGIRVNVVHPDAVFDTGLWSDEVIAQRAASYRLTPEQYRTRNLLGTEVSSADAVAVLVVACAAPPSPGRPAPRSRSTAAATGWSDSAARSDRVV